MPSSWNYCGKNEMRIVKIHFFSTDEPLVIIFFHLTDAVLMTSWISLHQVHFCTKIYFFEVYL